MADPRPDMAERKGMGLRAVTCERCQGNGEIVTDWKRYLHPKPGDQFEDETVVDCPDCGGTGKTD